MNCKLPIFLLFVLAGICGVGSWRAIAEDWPQFRGPNRNGVISGDISDWTKSKPKLVRTIKGAGQGFASLCVVKGKVYTTGNSPNSQYVACFDLDSGEQIWKRELVGVRPNHAYIGSRCTPTFDENRLFVTSSDGQLFCLDVAENLEGEDQGRIVWQKSFQRDFGGRIMSGWGYSESPLVDGDRVVVTPGGMEAMVVALNKMDGSTIWAAKLNEEKEALNSKKRTLKEGAAYCSVIKASFFGKPQYLQFVGRGLIGIDCDTGKVLWMHSASANRFSNICAPVFTSEGRVLYTSAPNGGISIFDIVSRRNGFTTKNVGTKGISSLVCHHGGMVSYGDSVFFGSGENKGYPTCIDMGTGRRKWGGSFRGKGRGSAGAILVGNKVILRYQNGVVAMFAANPDRYKILGDFEQSVKSKNQSWAHPVVVSDKLLLRENDTIMVYELP